MPATAVLTSRREFTGWTSIVGDYEILRMVKIPGPFVRIADCFARLDARASAQWMKSAMGQAESITTNGQETGYVW